MRLFEHSKGAVWVSALRFGRMPETTGWKPVPPSEKSVFIHAHLCESVGKMIHPSAVIHPQAKLDPSVRVGPCAVIDADVEMGADCVVGPHVYITGVTKIGAGNQFHSGCVIGDAPEDLKYKGEPTRLVIGDRNVFREHCTINRSTTTDGATVIGSHCFFMDGVHVAHNCMIGNHVIIVHGAGIAGHGRVDDRAFISGGCLIHQFCRIGTLVIMQGGAAISKDLAPFTVARGANGICGLNVIGLRRAGYSAAERLELKKLYQALFRSGRNLTEAVTEARETFSSPGAKVMLDFIASSKRGVCVHTGLALGETEE